MKKAIFFMCLLKCLFLTAQEQQYGTLVKCNECNVQPYLGTYKYVAYIPYDHSENQQWITLAQNDSHFAKKVVFSAQQFSGFGLTVTNPIYSIDKYRLVNKEGYVETNRVMRTYLSYYHSILENYGDYTYMIGVRSTVISGTIYNYADYFYEIYGEKLISREGDNFYLLEKTN
jgi:hypothetical protein